MRRIARGVVDAAQVVLGCLSVLFGCLTMTVVLVLAIAVLPVIVLACIVSAARLTERRSARCASTVSAWRWTGRCGRRRRGMAGDGLWVAVGFLVVLLWPVVWRWAVGE